MDSGVIKKSDFRPAICAANRHVQTLLPTLLRFNNTIHYKQQEITLPDGDFLDLAWNRIPLETQTRPIVAIFHGLEGSINSPYVKGLMQCLDNCGWHGVLMHFRNCSERLNRAARTYHSGETTDARFFLQWLQHNFPQGRLFHGRQHVAQTARGGANGLTLMYGCGGECSVNAESLCRPDANRLLASLPAPFVAKNETKGTCQVSAI